jgi:hypothetical protein
VKFVAKWAGWNTVVRDEQRQWFPDGSSRVTAEPITVDFSEQALGLEQYEAIDPSSGDSGSFKAIRGGGYYDTLEAQAEHRWTDEERELVEATLMEYSENGPNAAALRALPPHRRPAGFGDVKIWEPTPPTPPWPTYEQVPAAKVAQTAAAMGLARESLNYEQRRDTRRPSVIEALEKEVALLDAEAELTAVET